MNGLFLQFTTVSHSSNTPTARTEYISDRNTRSEHGARVNIFNRDLGYVFEMEPARRVYTAHRVNENGGKKVKSKPRTASGKTILHHTETVDTGERKELFGYTARHVITKTPQMLDAELQNESVIDGWYIDQPAARLSLFLPAKPGVFSYITSGTDDHKFTHTGERETGFPLISVRTSKSFVRDGTGEVKVHQMIQRDEVTAFSEAPLDAALFVPPHGYKRVSWIPDAAGYKLAYRLRLRWEMLKDSLTLSRRIAGLSG